MSEPLLVALVLGAVRVALAGRVRGGARPRRAGGARAPEAWLLLALYAAWCVARAAACAPARWRRSPSRCPRSGSRPSCSARAAGAPGRAQRGTGDPLEALCWASALPLARRLAAGARWRRGSVGAPRAARRRRARLDRVVAAMTLLDFPACRASWRPPRRSSACSAASAWRRCSRARGAPSSAAPWRRSSRSPLVVTAIGLPGRSPSCRRRGAARRGSRLARAPARGRARGRRASRCCAAGAWRRATCSCAPRWRGSSAAARRRRELRRAVAAVGRVRRRPAGVAGPARRDARRRDACSRGAASGASTRSTAR